MSTQTMIQDGPASARGPLLSRFDPKGLAAIGAGIAGGLTYVASNAVAQTLACGVPASFAVASIDIATLI